MVFVFAGFSVLLIVYKAIGWVDISWPIALLPVTSGIIGVITWIVGEDWWG